MILFMSKSSYTGGHSFWTEEPKPLPSFHGGKLIDLMYHGAHRLTGGTYNLELLFPKLVIQQKVGCKMVEIVETEGGYIIRDVTN